jgi:hypothetical protein
MKFFFGMSRPARDSSWKKPAIEHFFTPEGESLPPLPLTSKRSNFEIF